MKKGVENAADVLCYDVAKQRAKKLHDAGKLKYGELFHFRMNPIFDLACGVSTKIYRVSI